MIRRLLCLLVLVCAVALPVGPAARAQDDEGPPNAKLQGYDKEYEPQQGASLTYLLLIFIFLLTVGVMFKNARRTHLD
jgi:hypothetical protein